ncbi:MAG: N-acetylmuramoyl-L-alanine amidase [Elusimicrobia bacterium]|nr:N-acetylmuramoyl-L-alanine amidase [Elusimicrobiota bacterium]MDY6040070.1 N-acetylmuramoyl-L-alanine amidase [Elusimicrobiaceae bacterium]
MLMKRVWTLLVGLLALCFSGAAYAQGRTPVVVSGRSAGNIPSLEANGVTYVDVQAAARKFGAGVELFAQSKQAKITAKGFYGILTAPLPEIIINAKTQTLSSPVLVNGGKIMAPAEFFLLSSFQKAVGKRIALTDGKFIVERPFDFARTDNVLHEKDTLLVFETEKDVRWSSKQVNKHTVQITFPGATVKRDEFFRLKTPFIASAEIRQARTDAVLKVILGKNAKDWSFSEIDGRLVFRAGAQAAPAVLAERSPAAPRTEAPAETVSASEEPVHTPEIKGPSPVTEKPSVLMEDDGFEEMFPEPGPVIKPEPAPEPSKTGKNAPAPAKTAPVIKQEPHPLAVSSAHKKMRIVVDPGHGGKDPGAVRSRMREKDWNLAVGKELATLLKKAGFEVKMTRDNDTFIALSERSKISNNFKADLFVSVHTNASKNRNAHGFQVYFRSEKATDKEAADVAAMENEAMQYEEVHYNFVDALLQSLAKNEFVNESSKLAGYVRNSVYKQPGIGIAVNQNSSVRQANFYVLKGVNSPAILVEMGYISSSKDRARLSNKTVQKKMAQGIFNGVRDYAKKEGWIN